MKGSRIKEALISYWYILLITPFLIIGMIAIFNDREDHGEDPDSLDMVVGFYISGESFSNELIDEDISDNIGMSSDNVRFYYLVDYSGFGNTEFFTGSNYSREYLNISEFMPYDASELNMGDKDTFEGFCRYIDNIEAKRHYLIVWGHGKGSDGVCFDGETSLNGNEIMEALTDLTFDLIIFDACEMGSLDFLHTIQGVSQYVIASEKDIPDRGLDYANGFATYLRNGMTNPKDLGKCLIDATIDFYRRDPSIYSIQLSLYDLTEIDSLYSRYMSIDPNDLVIIPDYLESGKRVDMIRYLEVNGIDGIEIINDVIILNSTLQSSEGINVDDLHGISLKPY